MPATALDLRQLAEFPSRFTKLRSRLGVPQKELARWLGVSSEHVCQLEHGRQAPSAPLFQLFEKLEEKSTHQQLVMHEPAASEREPIALGLPPEALALLDQVHPADKSSPPSPMVSPSKPPMTAQALRVKALRDLLGVTRPKLAVMLGVSRQYITNIENGKRASKPIMKLVEKLEAEFAPKPSAPEPLPEPLPEPAKTPRIQPSIPPMAAGVTLISPRLAAIPLISMRDALLLSSPLHSARFAREHFAFGVTDPEAFAMRISGDSMQPLHVDGEIAILYPQSQPRTGDRVIVRVHDDVGGAVLFRIYNSTDHGRSVMLTSPNPVAPPITLSRDEILWICPVASTVRNLLS